MPSSLPASSRGDASSFPRYAFDGLVGGNVIVRVAVLCLAFLNFAWPLSALAVEVALTPVRDNAIYQENPSNSNGAGYLFAGRAGGGGIRRALLRFDVATAVPQNARIDSVELTLVVSRAASAAVLPATLHRILADWGEAGSSAGERAGAGAAAQPGDATWTARFFGGATWSSQGGDFATAPSAGGGLGGVGTYTIASTATLVSDVQMWLDSPQTNFGWILRGDESEAFTARRINSREFNDAQLRPVLRITYSDTPPAGNVPLPPWTLLAQGSLLGALLWKRQSKR